MEPLQHETRLHHERSMNKVTFDGYAPPDRAKSGLFPHDSIPETGAIGKPPAGLDSARVPPTRH